MNGLVDTKGNPLTKSTATLPNMTTIAYESQGDICVGVVMYGMGIYFYPHGRQGFKSQKFTRLTTDEENHAFQAGFQFSQMMKSIPKPKVDGKSKKS